MSIGGIFKEYFVNPILYNTGYNTVNTLTYALILGLASLGAYKVLKRMGIKYDNAFFRALIPYMILGSFSRALTDATIIPRTFLTVTPGIYLVMGVITFSSLLITHRFFEDWRRIFLYTGWSLIGIDFLLLITHLDRVNLTAEPLKYFIPFVLLAEGVIYLLTKKIRLVRDNSYLFYAHFYDATTTFVGVDFMGYWEQHVLPRYLINFTGTAAIMYLLKFTVLLIALYLMGEIEETESDKELMDFIKMVIFILGFAPGTRNLLRMLMGV
ncbi:DUF63 family protein [Palaeococcus sp. (in: euryarchaeotes)]|uniref:DUF63 family protein n=1 Tax=Palaeococcus sp. (in: euryarchaeotes) TaxID=2820298 RepID=UPI0025DE9A7B|nr:DUF63 family protein [Palaeococcus sp. (in: euryarchaeotes)]MCD6560089.1 DUF63 family protein [Palaeococcus sp. (in: euryarchaeotes)]